MSIPTTDNTQKPRPIFTRPYALRSESDLRLSPREWLLLAILLLAHALLAYSAVSTKSMTFDEPLHIYAGYVDLKLGSDYRPEMPFLTRSLAALPLLAADPIAETPLRQNLAWPAPFFDLPSEQVLHLVAAGRACMLGVSVALVAAVFFVSRRLWGPRGGWLSAFVAAFCPTLLANGPLCTSDAAAGLFFFLSIVTLWRAMHFVTPANVIYAGLAMAGLMLSKMSGPIVLVVAAWMLALRALAGRSLFLRRHASEKWRRVKERLGAVARSLAVIVAAGIITWALIWAAYGFRAHAPPDSVYAFTWPVVTDNIDKTSIRVAEKVSHYSLLPESYLLGAAYTVRSVQSRRAFFMGEYLTTGTPAFFPFLIAAKTPLATLSLFGVALVSIVLVLRKSGRGRRWRWAYRLAPLVFFLVFYLAAAIQSSLNIGHRHVLPIYPVIYILIGAASLWLPAIRNAGARASRAAGYAVLLLACTLAAETLSHWPHYLAYFNPLVGTSKAYRFVVDSSLDWGQDLPAVRSYLLSRGVGAPGGPAAYISYFGAATPAHYGVPAIRIPINDTGPIAMGPLGPGIYCVSVSNLQGVYTERFGRWDAAAEEGYRQFLPVMKLGWRSVDDPAAQRQLDAIRQSMPPAQWDTLTRAFLQRRHERLLAYLRHREPFVNLGGSVAVFNLSAADLQQALEGPPPE